MHLLVSPPQQPPLLNSPDRLDTRPARPLHPLRSIQLGRLGRVAPPPGCMGRGHKGKMLCPGASRRTNKGPVLDLLPARHRSQASFSLQAWACSRPLGLCTQPGPSPAVSRARWSSGMFPGERRILPTWRKIGSHLESMPLKQSQGLKAFTEPHASQSSICH